MIRSLLLGLFFISAQLSAQRLENIRAEAVNGGEKVIINYDINGASADQKYKISVYSSHNAYSTPLIQVTGDIHDVTPGTNKRIEWNARNEMVQYSGDITFELRADIIAPAIKPIIVKTPSGVKPGKSTTISWEGTGTDPVKLDLVKGGVVVNQIGNTTGSSYTWSVPSDVAKSSDYQIRLTSNGKTANSGNFPVKGKIKPIVFYVAGGAVVVVVAILVAKSLTGGGGGSASKDLPTPPDPIE